MVQGADGGKGVVGELAGDKGKEAEEGKVLRVGGLGLSAHPFRLL